MLTKVLLAMCPYFFIVIDILTVYFYFFNSQAMVHLSLVVKDNKAKLFHFNYFSLIQSINFKHII